MEKDKDNIVLTQDVTFISVVPLDFMSTDGSKICGYKIHYYCEVSESEKIRIFGKQYGNIYIAKEKLDDLDKYKNKIYPIKGQIQFQITSLDKKPKPIKVML